MTIDQTSLSGYKISVSAIFGIISFFLNLYGIEFQIANQSISLYLGLTLPTMIAVIWGWKYGLISVIAGGYFPVFFFWEPEGYGKIFLFFAHFLWVIWHGVWKEFREKSGDSFWNNVITLEILYRFFMIISYFTIYPYLLSLNPPFWNTSVYLNSRSAIYLVNYILLYSFVFFFIILFFKLSLSNKTIRRLFKLDPIPWQNKVRHLICILIGVGIILWFLSGVYRHYIVYLSTIPLKQILFYRGFNNYFIHDMIVISFLTLIFIIYEYQIKSDLESRKILLEKEFSEVTELQTYHAILSECFDIIKALLHCKNNEDQIVVLCRTFPLIPRLKNHWILRFQSESSNPLFLSETPDDTRQHIMAYINSDEGKIRLKKLLNSGEPAIVPAVVVNQRDLFPDIYHVLISACHMIKDDFLYIGLIVEENLNQTRLFRNFLITSLKAFHSPVIQDPPKDNVNKKNLTYENNMFVQSFYSIIPGYWILTNPSFSIIITSQDFCRFSGYSVGEIKGADLRTFLIQDSNTISPVEAHKLSEGFIIQKNGSRVPVQYICSQLSGIGSSVYLFHIADNLTGYMKLKALDDREFRYRSYFNNMSDASFVIDRTTSIIDVNKTACSLFKYNRNELIGLKIEDIVSEEDRRNIEFHMQAILQKNIARFESTHLTKYGHRILTEVHARRFNEYGHDLIHVVLRNISERKKQERDLIHFQKTIQLFAQKGQTIFVSFTEQEQIRFFNQAALELSGRSEGELSNSVFHEVYVSPEYQQKAEIIFQNLIKNKPDDSRHILPGYPA